MKQPEGFPSPVTCVFLVATFLFLVYLNGFNFPTLVQEAGIMLTYFGVKQVYKNLKKKTTDESRVSTEWGIFRRAILYVTMVYWICLTIVVFIVNFWGGLIALFLSVIFGGVAMSGGRVRHSNAGYYYTESQPVPPLALALFILCFLFFSRLSLGFFSPIPDVVFFFAGVLSVATIYLELTSKE